jgi:hypothetical protein
MSNERQGHVLEKQVAAWLTGIGATFVSEALIGKNSKNRTNKQLRADFLLVRPFPMVIEVLANASPHSHRMKTKRMMHFRLLVEQELGAHVPFVVLIDQPSATPLAFVDAIFSVSNLPTMDQLSQVRVNPEFLRFFSEGSVAPTLLTSLVEFKQAWQSALTLEALWSPTDLRQSIVGPKPHQSNSMAWQISQSAQVLAANEVTKVLRRPEMALVSRARMKHLRSVVENTIESTIGGKRTSITVAPAFLADHRFTFEAWRTSSIGTVVVAAHVWSGVANSHKISEWSVDGRLLLASGQVRRDGLIFILIPREGIGLDDYYLSAVNELEAAGWRVFPSDFGQTTPAFAKYLREMLQGAV